MSLRAKNPSNKIKLNKPNREPIYPANHCENKTYQTNHIHLNINLRKTKQNIQFVNFFKKTKYNKQITNLQNSCQNVDMWAT